MLAVMLAGSALTVQAKDQVVSETEQGKEFKVSFHDKEFERSFSDAELTKAIETLQPGDEVKIQIKVENSDSRKTTWYMKNDIIKSLEDSENDARGGVYTYKLEYMPGDSSQESKVFYDSANVGGEKENTELGLNEIKFEGENTKDEEAKWFYMDQLKSKGNGTLSLTVGLDGETQGNAYQNTLASLQLNFAVERAAAAPSGGGSHRTYRDPDSSTPAAPAPASVVYSPGAVQTGDPSNMLLWSAAALASGLVLMFFVVCFYKKKKEE